MKRTLRLAGALAALSLLLQPLAVSAQTVTYDEATLTSLYNAYLKKGSSDTYLEKRIADERARIRTQADKEIKVLVEPSTKDDLSTDKSALPKAIDQQRALVDQLSQLIKTSKVDLDLLGEEERKYYAEPDTVVVTPPDEIRLTKTHGELLARKAILEERINALNAGYTLQQDRLSKLGREQWLDQFQTLFGSLTYLAIILGAVILDRIVRRRVAGRIEAKGQRYLIAKLVSAGIYTVAALWVISKLISDHPGALASLAIVGAGIAVALQDVVKDIMGWFLILQRRLFTLGNRVSIGAYTGDVIDIAPLRTTMLEVSVNGAFNAHERTGKTLYVPNSLILKESVLNYNTTSDFMSVEMQVTVTYASDWKKAEQLLHEALKVEALEFTEQARAQQRRRTALFYTMWEVCEPEVHVDLANNGIMFTLKFTVPIGKRRQVVTDLSRTILEQFHAHKNIDLAYNTIHIVGNTKNLTPGD